jgi:hypothetical protein
MRYMKMKVKFIQKIERVVEYDTEHPQNMDSYGTNDIDAMIEIDKNAADGDPLMFFDVDSEWKPVEFEKIEVIK